jgi:hypothetical protein
MKAFEVFVNGVRACTAGVAHDGVVSVIAHHFAGCGHDDSRLGAAALDVTNREYLHWDCPSLSLGDEITIRLVETQKVDVPARKQPASEE